jgi:hypothetical protein
VKGGPAKDASPPGKGFDPAAVSAGMAAFERSCATCHNAARSLERTKDLAGRRATVQRMADVVVIVLDRHETLFASRIAPGIPNLPTGLEPPLVFLRVCLPELISFA